MLDLPMPYEVTASAQVTVPRTCGTCGEMWAESFTVSSTSGPMWRSGVRGAGQSMRASFEATAEAGAPERGHVCPFCLHLSAQALATTFKDGLAKGILRIYDESLEQSHGVLSMIGCVFGALMVIPVPVAGIPLLALSLPFQLKARSRLKECRAMRPKVEEKLDFLRYQRTWLEQLAVRCALAQSKYPHGDFEPRFAWCWTVASEIKKIEADPTLIKWELPNLFDDLK